MNLITFENLVVGSALTLTDRQLTALSRLCDQQPGSPDGVLDGRTPVICDNIDGIGSIVVKSYARGGLMRFLLKRRYLKLGATRCQREFNLLQTVRNLGVNAPEPIAFAYRGRLLYRAWLITRQISQPITLARLATQDLSLAQAVMPSVNEQTSILIQNGIAHPDLHPGNVLVDGDTRIFLVDFDKGHSFSGDKKELYYRYLNRWQRAISKHQLPMVLYDMLQTGLSKRFIK